MKKRLVTAFLTVVMAVACMAGLTACVDNDDGEGASHGDVGSVNGTYDLYIGNTKTKEADKAITTIVLNDGVFTILIEGHSVRCSYDVINDNIVMINGSMKQTYTKEHNYYYAQSGASIDDPMFEELKYEVEIICKQGETPEGYTISEL